MLFLNAFMQAFINYICVHARVCVCIKHLRPITFVTRVGVSNVSEEI